MVWQQGRVSQQHKKALLRALIDKVMVQRLARDRVQARIVWKGGETTTLSIPVPVGALKDLAGAETMERIILERSTAGVLDETIAQELTALAACRRERSRDVASYKASAHVIEGTRREARAERDHRQNSVGDDAPQVCSRSRVRPRRGYGSA